MTHSESIKNLATALCNVQVEMPNATKDGVNPHFGNRFATLATVMQTALPILAKHGLSVMQPVGMNDVGHTTLTTLLMHVSGEWIMDRMPLLPVKNDPQAQGSAITYARRYALLSMIGMVADDDDDAETAMTPKTKAEAKKRVEAISVDEYESGTVCQKCGSKNLVEAKSGPTAKNPNKAYWKCHNCNSFSHWVKLDDSAAQYEDKPWKKDERFTKPVPPEVSNEDLNEVFGTEL